MVEQCIDERVVAMPGTGMNHQPGRFVDDEQVFVLKKNVQGNRFGLTLNFLGWRLPQFDPISASKWVAGPNVFSIQPNESLADEVLKAGARKLREFVREVTINPQPLSGFGYD